MRKISSDCSLIPNSPLALPRTRKKLMPRSDTACFQVFLNALSRKFARQDILLERRGVEALGAEMIGDAHRPTRPAAARSRYIGRHGTKRVAKAALIGAIPPLMLKTAAKPSRLADRGVRSAPCCRRGRPRRYCANHPYTCVVTIKIYDDLIDPLPLPTGALESPTSPSEGRRSRCRGNSPPRLVLIVLIF
jgi:hypothetical protein